MLQALRQTLRSHDLDSEWSSVVGSWDSGSTAQKERVIGWIRELRDELLDLADHVQDDLEIEFSVAVRYIELKSHWMMLNTRIQYELFRRGEASEENMYKASVCSMLIAALEDLLTDEDRRRIAEFLAEPLARGV